MRRGVLAAVAVGGLLVGLGLTQLPGRSAITDGVAALEAGNTEQAVAAFLPPGSRRPSATALYDAGTAWHARGDVPRALACWRAAREQLPRSDDLAHDVAFARAALPGTPTPVPAARPWMEVISADELGLLVLLLWAAAGVAVLRTRSRADALLAGALVLLAAGLSRTALDGRAARLHEPIAVTLVETVLRDAPELDAGERAVLAPGSELRALSRRGPFLLVVDGEGRRGWALAEAVVVPDPGGV